LKFNAIRTQSVPATKLSALDPNAKYIEALRIQAKMFLCDWSNWDAEVSRLLAGSREKRAVALPLTVLAVSPSHRSVQMRGAVLDGVCPVSPRPCGAEKPIRTTEFASPTYRPTSGSCGVVFDGGVFEQHDRRKFETFAFSYGVDDGSPTRARIKQSFEHFIDVRDNSCSDIARLLREHEIDIAVDLMGHTKGARRDPCDAARSDSSELPGLPRHDGCALDRLLIADRYVVPEALQSSYSEKLVYLPDTFQATIPDGAAPKRTHTGRVGLA